MVHAISAPYKPNHERIILEYILSNEMPNTPCKREILLATIFSIVQDGLWSSTLDDQAYGPYSLSMLNHWADLQTKIMTPSNLQPKGS